MTGSGEMILKNMFAWMLFSVEHIQAKQLWPVFPNHILDGKMRFIIYIILIR